MTEKYTSGTLYLNLFFQMIPMVAGLQPHICTKSSVQKATGTHKVVQNGLFSVTKYIVISKLKLNFGITSTFGRNKQEYPSPIVENHQLQGGNGHSKSKEITLVLIWVHPSSLMFS